MPAVTAAPSRARLLIGTDQLEQTLDRQLIGQLLTEVDEQG